MSEGRRCFTLLNLKINGGCKYYFSSGPFANATGPIIREWREKNSTGQRLKIKSKITSPSIVRVKWQTFSLSYCVTQPFAACDFTLCLSSSLQLNVFRSTKCVCVIHTLVHPATVLFLAVPCVYSLFAFSSFLSLGVESRVRTESKERENTIRWEQIFKGLLTGSASDAIDTGS